MPQYYNASIQNLVRRLRKFKDILDEELKDEIMKHEDIIVQMIADEQLYEKGIEGRGIFIMDYRPYTSKTIKVKQKKGQPYDRVTLRDTGEFHGSLHVEFDDKGFYVTSTDDKAKYLLARYGKTIFRLTDENLTTLLRDYIKPSLKEKILNKIKNG